MEQDQSFRRFPKQGADPAELVEFRNRHFAQYNTYRDRHMQRIVRNIYYDLGRQWIELHTDALIQGARGYVFREMRGSLSANIPRPVTNVVASSIDVEFATLAKRQWVPKVPTYSRNPRIEASAKVAHDILTDRLNKLDWDSLRDTFIRNCVTMGTAIFRSYWDSSHYDLVWSPVSEPMQCPSCSSLFSEAEAPVGLLALRSNNPNASMEMYSHVENANMEETTVMEVCPECRQGNLQPTNLSEESSHGEDVFGRPLGGEVPKGNTGIEIIIPTEYYPQNAGVFINPLNARMHGTCKVRSLDYVEEHWPELAGKVQPEDPVDLLREHPLLGEWDIVGRFDTALDAGIFDNHVRVYEMTVDPTYQFPKGRLVRHIGEQQALLADDRDLIVDLSDESGKKIAHTPLVLYASARWKVREQEFWGKGLPDDIVSPQNRINGIDSQTIDARERMGSPNLLIPEDADLQGPEFRAGYGGAKLFRYRIGAMNPNAKPEVFGSILMPQGVNTEREQMMQDITKIIGPADIEIGEAPRNVTTTSGLQILGEQAERRRGTRERGITTAFKKVWEHQLQMLWVLREDPDEYEAESPDGVWETHQFKRDAIAGHTRVDVERQAYIDRSIVIRESTRQAITDGLVDLNDPLVRKKAVELMGLPNDLNERSNVQIDHAKRMWVDFVDEGKLPLIDGTLDDPFLISQVLGTYLKQHDGQLLQEQAGWPVLAPLLAGWQDEFQRVSQADQMAREKYGGEPPPQKAQEMFAQMKVEYTNAKEKYDAAASGKLGPDAQMAAMQSPPPEPPPPPVFLPRQIEERIFLVWQQMLDGKIEMQSFYGQLAAKSLNAVDDVEKTVERFLRFRAVVEGYKLMSGPGAPAPGGMAPGAGPEPAGTPGGQSGGPPVGSEPLPPKPPPTPPVPV